MGLAKDKLNDDEASPVEFNRDLDEVFHSRLTNSYIVVDHG